VSFEQLTEAQLRDSRNIQNPGLHHRVHRISPLIPILRQLIPVKTHSYYLTFALILSSYSKLMSYKLRASSMISAQNFVCTLQPMCAISPAQSILSCTIPLDSQ